MKMKKRLKRIAFIFAGVLAFFILALIILVSADENDRTVITEYVRNENLPTVKNDWRGTPVDEKDRFVNDEFPYLPRALDILKWTWESNPQAEEKKNDATRLKVLDPAEFLNSEQNGILWLGHASFFIRLNGKSILIDPVFGKPPLVKTYVDAPSPIDKIRRVDDVLISHDHRDHCDADSIKQIAAKFPDAGFYAGLRMDELVEEWLTDSNKMQTAGWYQQFKTPDDDLKIYFLPARHWSRRGLFDTNRRLWGAFVIQGADTTIYFGGDSGYDEHYKKLANLFPNIDYFIVGIGAYKPRWIMRPNHNTPEEALRAFADSGAKNLIPMHFGRFDLSNEPPSDPLRLLNEKAREMNLSDKIKLLNINESLVF